MRPHREIYRGVKYTARNITHNIKSWPKPTNTDNAAQRFSTLLAKGAWTSSERLSARPMTSGSASGLSKSEDMAALCEFVVTRTQAAR